MNNRRVDQSNERGSVDGSMDKRRTLDSTVIADNYNQSKRQDIASKIANAKHDRLDKSPVMKYLSISLVKENKPGSSSRNNSKKSAIKFHNYNPNGSSA